MSKMGISTLASYCGAQIFEARRPVEGASSTGTSPGRRRASSGVGIEVVAEEVRRRHEKAFPRRRPAEPDLDWGGEYQWRRDGEYHLFNPRHRLQAAARDAQRAVRDLQGIHAARRRPEPAARDAARPAQLQAGRGARSRSTRSSRSSRSSSASRPARCRTARSARRRTRRSRSR